MFQSDGTENRKSRGCLHVSASEIYFCDKKICELERQKYCDFMSKKLTYN